MKVKSERKVAQSCLTPSDPMDCSPPGSSIHGIFQARVLEWVAIAFSEIWAREIQKLWVQIHACKWLSIFCHRVGERPPMQAIALLPSLVMPSCDWLGKWFSFQVRIRSFTFPPGYSYSIYKSYPYTIDLRRDSYQTDEVTLFVKESTGTSSPTLPSFRTQEHCANKW